MCVGKEQVSQDGVVTLSRFAPAPHFVKSDRVTAEISPRLVTGYSVQCTCMGFTMEALAAAAILE